MTRPSITRTALVAMALGVALLVPSAASAASTKNWTATTQFQYGNADCGANDVGLPTLGDLVATKHGGSLDLHVSLDGSPATASTTYDLYLYDGACNQVGLVGEVTTDAFGVADVTFKRVKGNGSTSYFATLHGTNGWNDSPIFPAN